MTSPKPPAPGGDRDGEATRADSANSAVVRALDAALDSLASAVDQQRPPKLAAVYAAVQRVIDSDGGILALAERAERYHTAGVFRAGPWEHPPRLLPNLVAAGLLADEKTAAVEIMSELRMLAIATGVMQSELSSEEAREFLRDVIVLNLTLLSPSGSEAERARPAAYARARTLLNYLLQHLSPSLVRGAFVAELDALCAQRPILTRRARTLIECAAALPTAEGEGPSDVRLELYRRAVSQPSPLSQTHTELRSYQQALASADQETLDQEARAFGASLRLTGLGNPHHALLLRHLESHDPSLLGTTLGLNAIGEATLQQQLGTVLELIRVAIQPETCDSIYGLAGMLERALLCRRTVVKSLARLANVSLHPSVTKSLMARVDMSSSLNANAALLAGAISVLGQPLGVGQGNNPTCQSARAISLWSLHAPGYLLNLLIRAASSGAIQLDFEGVILQSDKLTGGVATTIHPDLDPVSLVLVPHLDRIYDAMALRAAGRGMDVHRWVNPALYGRWVPLGFACAIDPLTHYVTGYDTFVRLFFATHHPAYSDGDQLLSPNPVGIIVTDVHGRKLGAHAVSLLRVEADPHGELRAYFFNPNNEGRQVWGPQTVVSVSGNGELPGESSLPFALFAARLYAFHYHPLEGGESDAVPDAVIAAVTEDSKSSWGRSYEWAL